MIASEPRAFRESVAGTDDYHKLGRLRRALAKLAPDAEAAQRVAVVEKRMRALIKSGGAKVRRRKPGTGERVEEQRVYGDTAANRRLGRVGQAYTVVRHRGAEYEERDAVLRRRKRARPGAAVVNSWLDAVARAKAELGAQGFVKIRREPLDPGDERDVLGARVYARAKELHAEIKASA